MAELITSAGHLLLFHNDQMLMLRRFNTGYEDGNYSVVAGHIEHGEPALEAIEANINVRVDDLEFAHIMFRRKDDGSVKADFFFTCHKWSGQIENVEEHKCDELKWFPRHRLPENTVPYIRAALEHVEAGSQFSEFGW